MLEGKQGEEKARKKEKQEKLLVRGQGNSSMFSFVFLLPRIRLLVDNAVCPIFCSVHLFCFLFFFLLSLSILFFYIKNCLFVDTGLCETTTRPCRWQCPGLAARWRTGTILSSVGRRLRLCIFGSLLCFFLFYWYSLLRFEKTAAHWRVSRAGHLRYYWWSCPMKFYTRKRGTSEKGEKGAVVELKNQPQIFQPCLSFLRKSSARSLFCGLSRKDPRVCFCLVCIW